MTVVYDREKDSRPRHPEKEHRPDTPVLRKPDWIRVKAPSGRGYAETRDIVRAHGLHTVCDYGVYGVPETYVIDKSGVIRYKRIGPLTPEIVKEKLLPLVRELGRA